MTTKERFSRMFQHKEADRVPIFDIPWAGAIARWEREGMPKGMDWRDYFDVDKVRTIDVDISPPAPSEGAGGDRPLADRHLSLGGDHAGV